jgi:hypothetical protein
LEAQPLTSERTDRGPATRSRNVYLAVLIFCALLAIMARVNDRSEVDDSTLAAAVRGNLAALPTQDPPLISIEVQNGTVWLNGMVVSISQKSEAEKATGRVKGVTTIVNNLQVQR